MSVAMDPLPTVTLEPMDPLRVAYDHEGLVRKSRTGQPSASQQPPVEPTRADGMLSIGVFARRSRLSMKALRLYERLGLLQPARVDRGNGCRHYRESQLATARLIAMLRRLDMPLAQVAEVPYSVCRRASFGLTR